MGAGRASLLPTPAPGRVFETEQSRQSPHRSSQICSRCPRQACGRFTRLSRPSALAPCTSLTARSRNSSSHILSWHAPPFRGLGPQTTPSDSTIVNVDMLTPWTWSCCSMASIGKVGLWAPAHFATSDSQWPCMAYKTQTRNVVKPDERFAHIHRNPPLLVQ